MVSPDTLSLNDRKQAAPKMPPVLVTNSGFKTAIHAGVALLEWQPRKSCLIPQQATQ
jgi:hypothetical protein